MSSAQPRHKRKIKLIKPRLQLKLTLTFVGLTAMALMLQVVLFTMTLTDTALSLPNDSFLLLSATNGIVFRILAISMLIFLPLTYAVGILTTFRVAGPLYRFETFLNQLLAGEKPERFHLRKGDELQEFAALLNDVTEPLRRKRDEPEAAEDARSDDAPSLVDDREEHEDEESPQDAATG